MLEQKVVYLELPMTGDYPPCPQCGDEQTIIVLPSIPPEHTIHFSKWLVDDLAAEDWMCPSCYIRTRRGKATSGWVYKQGEWYEEAGAEEVRS